MTTSRADHKDTWRTQYTEEQTTDQAQSKYPGADHRESWRESNTTLNFLEDMKAKYPDVAEAIDHRTDPRDFVKDHPEGMGEAIYTTFRDMSHGPTMSRAREAWDIAQTVLDPIRKEVDSTQAQYYFSTNPDHNHLADLDHKIADDIVQHRETQFIRALYRSTDDTQFAERDIKTINSTLHDPLAYPKSESEHYAKELFDWLKADGAPHQERVIDEVITYQDNHNLTESFNNDYAEKSIKAYNDCLKENLREAIHNNLESIFEHWIKNIRTEHAKLDMAIAANVGFAVANQPTYPKPPAEFKSLQEATKYIDQVNETEFPKYPTYPEGDNDTQGFAAGHTIARFNQELDILKSITQYPDKSELENLANMAKAISYLTRPEDQHFWKIADTQDHYDKLIAVQHSVDEATQYPRHDIALVHRNNPHTAETALDLLRSLEAVHTKAIEEAADNMDYAHYQEIHKGLFQLSGALAEASTNQITTLEGLTDDQYATFQEAKTSLEFNQFRTLFQDLTESLKDDQTLTEFQAQALEHMTNNYANYPDLDKQTDHPLTRLEKQERLLKALQLSMVKP